MIPQSRGDLPEPPQGGSGHPNSKVSLLMPLVAEISNSGHPVETVVHVAGASEALALLAIQLDKRGAATHAVTTPAGVLLRIQGISPAAVYGATETAMKGLNVHGPVRVIQVQRLAANSLAPGAVELPPGTTLRMHLTKRLLMILPTGGYIVSNCFNGFAEVLGPRDTREATWRRILEHRANGRLCMLLASPEESPWDGSTGQDTPF